MANCGMGSRSMGVDAIMGTHARMVRRVRITVLRIISAVRFSCLLVRLVQRYATFCNHARGKAVAEQFCIHVYYYIFI